MAKLNSKFSDKESGSFTEFSLKPFLEVVSKCCWTSVHVKNWKEAKN